MYDELVKRLQDYAAGTMRDDDAEIAFDAINAIEKLEHKVFILEGDREGLLAQIPRWIPVTEALPEIRKVVFITDGIDVGTGWMNQGWWNTSFDNIRDAVTHWMPLPQPPKEE